MSNVSGQVSDQILQSSLIVIVFLGLLFLAISIAASVVRVVIQYFDFEFSKTESSFQMQAGLFNKKSMVIPFKKIQELTWGTNPLKKAFSLFSVKIKQASSEVEKKKSSMEIPGCENKSLNQLKDLIFGESEFLSNTPYKVSKTYFWRVLLLMGFLPILVSLPLYIFDVASFIFPIIWMAFSIFGSCLAVKKRFFQISENQLIVSKGMFGQDWKQLEMYKIQVVDFKQSVFQKTSGLASILIYTASGRTSIPFIDETLARELHKFLIYKIQSSEKSWM